MPVLVVQSGRAGDAVELGAEPVLLGRSPDCDLRFASPELSRKHARVVPRNGGGYVVEDLGSSNGTLVNGELIVEPHVLRDGDSVLVGGVHLVYRDDEARVAAREEPPLEWEADRGTVGSDDAGELLAALEDARYERNAALKLRAVLETARQLSGSLSLDELVQQVLERAFGVFLQADRGCVLLLDAEGELRLRAHEERNFEAAAAQTMAPLSHSIAKRALAEGRGLLSVDAQADQRFENATSVQELEVHSVMCTPLVGPSRRPAGVVYLSSSDPERQFDDDDLDVFTSFAAVAALAIEHAHNRELLLEQLQQRQRLEREVAGIAAQERQRLGAELHDGLGQDLVALKMMVEQFRRTAPPDDGSLLEQIVSLTDQALSRARHLARGLHHAGETDEPVEKALERLAHEASKLYGFDCQFQQTGDPLQLDANVATQLVKIASEAVTNAGKHADAEHVQIALQRAPERLVLRVVDDGVGIADHVSVDAGVGTQIMKRRAALVDARVAVRQRDEGGTEVRCDLPL